MAHVSGGKTETMNRVGTQGIVITGQLLAKNTILNLAGYIIPALVALATVPYIVHGLGLERFGILSLLWVVLGYFTMLDLGLGVATTRFMADALGKGKYERIPKIFWTSLIVQVGLGLFGGLLVVLVTPLLTEKVLKISTHLLTETKIAFYILGGAIPIVVSATSLRGALAAAQRFDLINAVKIPASSLVFTLAAIGVLLGFKLPGIVMLLSLSWPASALTYFMFSFRVFPTLKHRLSFDKALFPYLLRFGGWVTLCNVLIPLLVYLDRFFIGAFRSTAVLAYYTAPYEMASRLLMFPSSLAGTFFPAFATLSGVSKSRLEQSYVRSLKWLLLTMGPLVAVGVAFAGDILHLWLGKEFAENSTLVLQLLMMGMLLNALAQMPAYLLDAIGRPDVRAKIFLSYVPIYIGFLWFGITKMGIDGVAMAWLGRAGLELLLFITFVWRLAGLNPFSNNHDLVKGLVAYGAFILTLFGFITAVSGALIAKVAAVAACLLAFSFVVWGYILNDGERKGLGRALTWLPWLK